MRRYNSISSNIAYSAHEEFLVNACFRWCIGWRQSCLIHHPCILPETNAWPWLGHVLGSRPSSAHWSPSLRQIGHFNPCADHGDAADRKLDPGRGLALLSQTIAIRTRYAVRWFQWSSYLYNTADSHPNPRFSTIILSSSTWSFPLLQCSTPWSLWAVPKPAPILWQGTTQQIEQCQPTQVRSESNTTRRAPLTTRSILPCSYWQGPCQRDHRLWSPWYWHGRPPFVSRRKTPPHCSSGI